MLSPQMRCPAVTQCTSVPVEVGSYVVLYTKRTLVPEESGTGCSKKETQAQANSKERNRSRLSVALTARQGRRLSGQREKTRVPEGEQKRAQRWKSALSVCRQIASPKPHKSDKPTLPLPLHKKNRPSGAR
ncbi:hypothetical protein NDU88_005519 [Pleurodeles waltl]|uniref:Uncharacterized protein n=1 Tax=Pleurodeles waltl TaxID=8319 RepID=A0AAV7SM39_PLEWA|nr:hypothetical protein NDU88_005519 [Pleurodeles waltl]